MAKASWNGQIIAESDAVELVEGNVYFPHDSIKTQFMIASDHQTTCGWKGVASYYHVVVGGQKNENAAWYYPQPKPAAENIKNYVAFWRGVEIET